MLITTEKGSKLLNKYIFPNKQLQKFKNMGIHWQPYYKYCVYDRTFKHYNLPRTALKYLPDKYNKLKYLETPYPELAQTTWLQLRPQQQKILDDIWDKRFALIQARTWFGKSYVIAWLIKKYMLKTLVVVPKKEIAKWLYEKFKDIYWDKVEVFNWKKMNIAPITIIVSASFRKYWWQLDWKFDMLIFDEAHMDLFGKERIKAMCYMHYTRLYWLTATPERDEIDSKYFENIYWPIIKADKDKNIIPSIYYKKYKPKYIDEWWLHWSEFIQQLIDDEDRTVEMVKTIIEVMSLKDRHMWIIFVDRLEMVKKISILLNVAWFPAREYTSKTQNRDEILKDMEEKRWVIVATYQTVWVWFDYPPLDTGFFYMNIKFKWTVKQAVWRILRKTDDSHKPILIDWQDATGNLYWQTRERIKAYKETFNNVSILDYNTIRKWTVNVWTKDMLRMNMTEEEFIGKAKSILRNLKE